MATGHRQAAVRSQQQAVTTKQQAVITQRQGVTTQRQAASTQGRAARMLLLALCAGCALEVLAAPRQDLLDRVEKEKPAVIESLREIVGIDSGSRDKPGLDKLATLIGSRLEALGAKVERASGTAEVVALEDTPKEIGDIVIGRLSGKGTRDILLLAHMDTVYPAGTVAKMPFRIDGNRAYGPGIADDKAGVALILHTLALLKAQGFDDYRSLTVVINGDEEISSPGSRKLIERIAAEHEVVFSCEPTPVNSDRLDIATSGIASASMVVHGRSSHAGAAPELGRNALTELAHRLLQLGELSDPARGIKFNWTMAQAGTTRNVIPDRATAMADVRVQKLDDYAAIEQKFLEAAKGPARVPDTRLETRFQQRRPPLEATDASRTLARKAQAVYGELGKKLEIEDSGSGGGTDAAFAALSRKPAVLESFGFAGANYHSNEAEYIDLESIVPRLYLLTRMVMDYGQDK
jgi:glutamate carboxypeptidase